MGKSPGWGDYFGSYCKSPVKGRQYEQRKGQNKKTWDLERVRITGARKEKEKSPM